MKVPITSADQLGKIIRATRKAFKLRQDDAAGSIGVSENFLGKVESGAENVQWQKLFQVLDGLGILLIADLPDEVESLPSASGLGTRISQRFRHIEMDYPEAIARPSDDRDDNGNQQ